MTRRQLIIVAHDVAMTPAALCLAFFLRWGSTEFENRLDGIVLVAVASLPIALASYGALGLFRTPWRYVSLPELGRIMVAAAIPALALVLLGFLNPAGIVIPRTVPAIYWLAQIALLSGPRVLYRAYRKRRRDKRAFAGAYRVPVIVVGSGDDAEQLIRRLRGDVVSSLDPVAMLATKAHHVGAVIQGVRVLGQLSDLDDVLRLLELRGSKPRRLVLTADVFRASIPLDDFLAEARRLGLSPVRVSQSLTRLDEADGPLKLAPISIDDLLGRSARELDLTSVRALIGGRRVLVTGAGGSIGSELCRQIAGMRPSRLMVLDHSELALWTVAKQLSLSHPELALDQHLGSVRDAVDLGTAFARFCPELIFHAAALKHVDIVEAHPVAAAGTNTLGTHEVARLARQVGATCVVFISTDKAVDPVSILGATKRAGELIFAAADGTTREAGEGPRFLTVRFGNVLGSSGSVIPLFTEQLGAGGPITVTDPGVERYFMTISEAVTLVLMASAEGVETEEVSPVYVLDMGEPIRIVELARRMIRLAGLEPDVDVQIKFTGLRPGERLSEALESEGESLKPTTTPGVRVTVGRTVGATILAGQLSRLRSAISSGDGEEVRGALVELAPEYRRGDGAKSLGRPVSSDASQSQSESSVGHLRIVRS